MYALNGMTITTRKDELLTILQRNRASHRTIVDEARAGYIEKARDALNAKLDSLAKGKVVALSFGLRLPVDQTSVYDTAIKMLEMHQHDTIELSHAQVQNLVLDNWDWSAEFRASSMLYSRTAQLTFENTEDEE